MADAAGTVAGHTIQEPVQVDAGETPRIIPTHATASLDPVPHPFAVEPERQASPPPPASHHQLDQPPWSAMSCAPQPRPVQHIVLVARFLWHNPLDALCIVSLHWLHMALKWPQYVPY